MILESNLQRDKKGWIILQPPEFADATKRLGAVHYKYHEYEFPYSSPGGYAVVKKLGHGKFSSVYLGVHETTGAAVVIKMLRPISAIKIQRETKVLNLLKNGPGIVELREVCYCENNDITSFVFHYNNESEMRTKLDQINVRHFKILLLKICIALQYCHSHGIMHRDVKTLNVVVNTKYTDLTLIDWGMAEFYHPGMGNTTAVATRAYKAPELLVGYPYYHYAIDMWGVGCMVATYFAKNKSEAFFKGVDNSEVLVSLVKRLGRQGFIEFCQSIGISDEHSLVVDMPYVQNLLTPPTSSHSLSNDNRYNVPDIAKTFDWRVHDPMSITNPGLFNDNLTQEALDLMKRLLCYDMTERYTARQTINHPFFDEIRSQVIQELSERGYLFDNSNCVIAIEPNSQATKPKFVTLFTSDSRNKN